MRDSLRWLGTSVVAFAVVATLSGTVFAHGGTFCPGAGLPPDPGTPLGPPYHGPKLGPPPEVTPGGNDPKVAVTRWETWWAANKDAYLRLAERLGGDAPNTTPSKVPLSEREQKAAANRVLAMRRHLAALFSEALGDKDYEVRTAAAVALGKTGEPSASEPLRLAATTDAHKDVRNSAVIGLGLLGRPTDAPFLEQMMCDIKENPRRRAFAAFALGLIGGDDAAIPLLRFASDHGDARSSESLRKKPELAAATFVAMGLSGCADVLPVLRTAAADGEYDENVRSFALISLGRMKDRGALQLVVTTLTGSHDPGLRRAAAVALGRIVAPDDKAATAALLSALRDDHDPLVRHFAAVALGAVPGADTRDALRDEFKRGGEGDAPFAALALALQHDADFAPTLRATLSSEKTDESMAGGCCIALGVLGDVASAPAIEKTLAGAKHIWLQGYAALALGMVGATSSTAALHAKLEASSDPRLRMNLAMALGMLHDPAAKTYLVDTLRGADTFYERGSAALALGALRCAGAVQDLEAVYRDAKEKDILRAFAVVALGEIADPSAIPKLARFSMDGNYDAIVRVDPLNEILTIY